MLNISILSIVSVHYHLIENIYLLKQPDEEFKHNKDCNIWCIGDGQAVHHVAQQGADQGGFPSEAITEHGTKYHPYGLAQDHRSLCKIGKPFFITDKIELKERRSST